MFDERASKILEAAIREFTRSGSPVSSDELYDHYDFGIKPASIRAELLRLTKSGLLEQPHTSGGRVPTEKGYGLMVNRILEEIFNDVHDTKNSSFGNALLADVLHRGLHSFVNDFAREFKIMGLGYRPKDGDAYKSGLDGLMERVDAESKDDLLEIIRDISRLEKEVEHLKSIVTGDSPKVFIGSQSPITKSRHLSVIADSYEVDGEQFFFVAVGPVRMDYQKPLKALKAIKQQTTKSRKQKIKKSQ